MTGPNSFVPGTHVLMGDGTTRPIEEVAPGDAVVATDPVTGKTQVRTVTATITGEGEKYLVAITVDTDGAAGDATATVTATDEHPFWLAELEGWVAAIDLRSGAWLQTSAGTWVQITAVTQRTQPTRVHNLTVDGIHTYYVLAGNTPVLVHNDDPFDTSRQARLDAMRRAGLPTSLTPRKATYYSAGYGQGGGYQYIYDYNGKTWVVTDNWNDLNADTKHGPHWEVGQVKPGGQTDSLGRLRVDSNKTKASYRGGC
jgi:hypothetical protein